MFFASHLNAIADFAFGNDAIIILQAVALLTDLALADGKGAHCYADKTMLDVLAYRGTL